LSVKDRRGTEFVKLRFFVGMSNEQTVEVLNITPETASAYWSYARAWLRVAMESLGGTGI
jgi:hypothetical protein